MQQQIAEAQRQMVELQQQQQQINSKVNQISTLGLSFGLNMTLQVATLSVVGAQASAARAVMSERLDGAVRVILSRLPRESYEADIKVRISGLLERLHLADQQIGQAEKVSSQANILLPTISETLKRAEGARAAVEAAETEVSNLRRRAEVERGKVTDLEEALINKRQEAVRLLDDINSTGSKVGQYESQIRDIMHILDRDRVSMSLSADEMKARSDEIHQTAQAAKAKLNEELIPEWERRISSVYEDADSKRNTIHELLGSAVAAKLSAAFKEREKQLGRGQALWFLMIAATTASITLISIFYIVPVAENAGGMTVSVIILRALTLLPLVLLDIFCVGRYTRNSSLGEQYAFKGAVAASFDYYKEELQRSLKEGTQVADFVGQTVGRLWAEPNHMTELSARQIRHFTKLLENLGVTALKEGSAVAQAVIHTRPTAAEATIPRLEAPNTQSAG